MPDLAFGDCDGCEWVCVCVCVCVCLCVLLGERVHMDQDGGAFWRPPGRVWVGVCPRRTGWRVTQCAFLFPDPSWQWCCDHCCQESRWRHRESSLFPDWPSAALTKTTSLTGSSGVRKPHQRRSNGGDSPLPSPSSSALLCRWGESKQGAVPGQELHRALLDPRGKRRRNETAQGHPGYPGVLSPPRRRGQLRTESWTGTGISAQCRIIGSRTTKERKINSGSQAISLLLNTVPLGRLCITELLSQPNLPSSKSFSSSQNSELNFPWTVTGWNPSKRSFGSPIFPASFGIEGVGEDVGAALSPCRSECVSRND